MEDCGLELGLHFPLCRMGWALQSQRSVLGSCDLLAVACSLFLGTPEDGVAVLAHLDTWEVGL